MNKPHQKCDLCQQIIEIEGFEAVYQAKLRQFCCEGCKSLFMLVNQPDRDPNHIGFWDRIVRQSKAFFRIL